MATVCEQTHDEEGGGGLAGVRAAPEGGAEGRREGEREDKSKGGDSPRLTLFRNEDRT